MVPRPTVWADALAPISATALAASRTPLIFISVSLRDLGDAGIPGHEPAGAKHHHGRDEAEIVVLLPRRQAGPRDGHGVLHDVGALN